MRQRGNAQASSLPDYLLPTLSPLQPRPCSCVRVGPRRCGQRFTSRCCRICPLHGGLEGLTELPEGDLNDESGGGDHHIEGSANDGGDMMDDMGSNGDDSGSGGGMASDVEGEQHHDHDHDQHRRDDERRRGGRFDRFDMCVREEAKRGAAASH